MRKNSLLWEEHHLQPRKDCHHGHINTTAVEAGRTTTMVLEAVVEMVVTTAEVEGAADGDPGVAHIAVWTIPALVGWAMVLAAARCSTRNAEPFAASC
jgi:hypothetical protein